MKREERDQVDRMRRAMDDLIEKVGELTGQVRILEGRNTFTLARFLEIWRGMPEDQRTLEAAKRLIRVAANFGLDVTVIVELKSAVNAALTLMHGAQNALGVSLARVSAAQEQVRIVERDVPHAQERVRMAEENLAGFKDLLGLFSFRPATPPPAEASNAEPIGDPTEVAGTSGPPGPF